MRVFLIVAALFWSVNAYAQRWTTGETKGKSFAYASTTNESGGSLEQYCAYEDGLCYWTLSSGSATCTANESYPALVNSDIGAVQIDMYCFKVGDGFLMIFKHFDSMDAAVKQSKNIAIAVPMSAGGFRVSRFNTAGAAVAISAMQAAHAKKASKSTRDIDL